MGCSGFKAALLEAVALSQAGGGGCASRVLETARELKDTQGESPLLVEEAGTGTRGHREGPAYSIGAHPGPAASSCWKFDFTEYIPHSCPVSTAEILRGSYRGLQSTDSQRDAVGEVEDSGRSCRSD